MIRNVGKKIKRMKYMEVEETVTKEKIVAILQYPEDKTIKVDISLLNSLDELVGERSALIERDNYDLLLSDSDFFEEGKEIGVFRESDLWKLIDQVGGVV